MKMIVKHAANNSCVIYVEKYSNDSIQWNQYNQAVSQSIEMLPIFNKHAQINCFDVNQCGNEFHRNNKEKNIQTKTNIYI